MEAAVVAEPHEKWQEANSLLANLYGLLILLAGVQVPCAFIALKETHAASPELGKEVG